MNHRDAEAQRKTATTKVHNGFGSISDPFVAFVFFVSWW